MSFRFCHSGICPGDRRADATGTSLFRARLPVARPRGRWVRRTGVLVLGWALLSTGYAAGPDDVDYRQNVMKTLGAQVLALELVLQDRAPAHHLKHHIEALAAASAQILSAFEAAAEGGNAKPAVWSNWEDFTARAREQAERLAALRRGLASGGVAAADAREALVCTGCHDTYRREMEESRPEAGGTADRDDRDIVDYRRYLMQAMDAQTAALGQILAWMVADEHFVSHLQVIGANAKMAVGAFEPALAGGKSLPRIWTNREDFSARMQALADGVAKATNTASELGKDAALGPVMDALTCDRCHDLYRETE